jgi:ABC-type Fe3+-hydroxamate transport system substrate-binding protein
MHTYTDQMGFKVCLNNSPQRIVSLVPSLTELICDLGLENRLVGITKFCVHPENVFNTKTKVGGTKIINFETIRDLNPDIIIANKEENTKDIVIKLKRHFPVWVSDINTLDDATEMIERLGEIFECGEKAAIINQNIIKSFRNFKMLPKHKKALYLIWRKPWMTVANGTFIDEMLKTCNFTNVVKDKEARYPVIEDDEIRDLKPDYIFLSSEPYPFREKHIDEIRRLSPRSQVILVDGEMFSWYGSRLQKSAAYFESLIHNIN